jgi:hypothetical protein
MGNRRASPRKQEMKNMKEKELNEVLGEILPLIQEKLSEKASVQQEKPSKVKDSWGYRKKNADWKRQQKYAKLERDMNEKANRIEQEKLSKKPSKKLSDVERIALKWGKQQEKLSEPTEEQHLATGVDIGYGEMKEYFLKLKKGNLPLAKEFISWATGELLK